MLHQDLSTNQSAVCASEENDVVFDGTTFDLFNPVTTVDISNILHSLNSTNCKLDPLRGWLETQRARAHFPVTLISPFLFSSLSFKSSVDLFIYSCCSSEKMLFYCH